MGYLWGLKEDNTVIEDKLLVGFEIRITLL